MLSKLKGFIFDLDGTIYIGEKLIDGAVELIELLRSSGRKVLFLSNKPIEARENYAAKLSKLGIETSADEVINSSYVLTAYLKRNFPDAKIFPIAEPPMIDELLRNGFAIVDEPEEVDIVAIAMDRRFNYRKLNIAYQSAIRGAKLIATNPDKTLILQGGTIPDCASMIAAIEACVDRKIDLVVGKPSPIMMQEALNFLDLRAEDCAMIGDRLETDMVMGREMGLTSILVLTGHTKKSDLEQIDNKPDLVVSSVKSIFVSIAKSELRRKR